MDKDDDLNSGVQIILNRMKSHPEEFFDEGGRWKWIFKDTLREVLTEIEKAALYDGLKQVRRLELTSKAAATVLRADEQEKRDKESYAYDSSPFSMAPVKKAGSAVQYAPLGTQKQSIGLQIGQEHLSEDDIREILKKLGRSKY